MKHCRVFMVLLLSLAIGLLSAGLALADNHKGGKTYQVTITNLTKRQVFSPPLLVSHKASIQLFNVGMPASDGIVAIAEGGDSVPLEAVLGTLDEVFDVVTGGGPIAPGHSMTLEIDTRGRFNRISLVGMLVSTNDAFYALNSKQVPYFGQKMLTVPAYDAGSEANTELCKDLPGPCTVEDDRNDRVTAGAEGFVYVHNGIHGVDEVMGLNAANMDWRNPVARVLIKKMR